MPSQRYQRHSIALQYSLIISLLVAYHSAIIFALLAFILCTLAYFFNWQFHRSCQRKKNEASVLRIELDEAGEAFTLITNKAAQVQALRVNKHWLCVIGCWLSVDVLSQDKSKATTYTFFIYKQLCSERIYRRLCRMLKWQAQTKSPNTVTAST